MSLERSRGLASQPVDLLRIDGSQARVAVDRVACEAALEVRLGESPFSVIMRTPGDDAALALGFLFTEGVIASADDVLLVTSHPEDDIVVVDLAPALVAGLPALLAGRRQVTTTSSCGMCGRPSRESIDVVRPVMTADWKLPAALLTALPGRLRAAQAAFDETGGLHAAAPLRSRRTPRGRGRRRRSAQCGGQAHRASAPRAAVAGS